MKTYHQSSQNGTAVFFDTARKVGFLADSPLHTAMQAEVAAGTAQVITAPSPTYRDIRAARYRSAGLTESGWLEAIVEFLGTLPNPPAKFAELWAVREQIRSEVPSS